MGWEGKFEWMPPGKAGKRCHPGAGLPLLPGRLTGDTKTYEISLWQRSKKFCLAFGQENLDDGNTLWLTLATLTLPFSNEGHCSAIRLREYYHKKLILSSVTEEWLVFLPFTWRWDYSKLHVITSAQQDNWEAPSVFSLCWYKGLESKWPVRKMGKKTPSKPNNIFKISKEFDSHIPNSPVTAVMPRVTN